MYSDGGRAEAGYASKTDKDCVTRAISIATRRPYNEIHETVDTVGAEDGVQGAAEAGVQLLATAKLLIRDLRWKPVDAHRDARLTLEDLEKQLAEHRVLIAEVEFSETQDTSEGRTCRVISHVTAIVDGVVHDIDGMANPATGEARICDRVVQLYAPPD